MVLPCFLQGQEQLRFNHISVEDGLSQSTILSLEQDALGYLWVGTADGLNVYDGYRFQTMRHDPRDTSSISDNEVMALDFHQGSMWIGTAGGIDILNMKTQKCRHYNVEHMSNKISSNYVANIVHGASGKTYVGTAKGFNVFDHELGKFETYAMDSASWHPSNNVLSTWEVNPSLVLIGTRQGLFKITDGRMKIVDIPELKGLRINTLLRDRNEQIWMGTDHGLYQLDLQFSVLKSYDCRNSGLYNDYIRSLALSQDGSLWIGTENGLSVRKMDGKIYSYRFDPNNPFSLSNNTIHSLLEDRWGSLWIGTGSGLNRLDDFSFQFNPTLIFADGTSNNQLGNKIWSFAEVGNQLWVGTESGLYQFKKENGSLRQTQGFERFPNNIIRSIIAEENGVLWLGTEREGLIRYDSGNDSHRRFRHAMGDSTTITSNIIRHVAKDDDLLWIATGYGLCRFNLTEYTFQRYYFDHSDGSFQSLNSLRHILVDDDRLWINSERGLIAFQKDSGDYKIYCHVKGDSSSLSHNFGRTSFIDSSENLWVGTSRGLNLLDRSNGTFKRFHRSDGLPSEMVYAIEEDGIGQLWISTNHGLSTFDPKSRKFVNYTTNDGLQSLEFNTNASIKTAVGQLIFGGINGLNVFDAERITQNEHVGPIYINSLEIFHQRVSVTNQGVLRTNIQMADTIYLDYEDDLFTLRFSAINFLRAKDIRYKYKLEGFDRDWNEVGSERSATYTKVPGGVYDFHVMAGDDHGHWSKQKASTTIIVASPFWEKRWFGFVVMALVFLFILIIFRIRTRHIARRNLRLRNLVTERTKTLEENKEALTKSEALFRGIYEQSPVGIAYLDIEPGVIKQCNKQLTDILGYSEGELLGNGISTYTHLDDLDDDIQAYQKAVKDPSVRFYHRKKRLLHKSGHIKHVNTAVTITRNYVGEAQSLIIIINDVSDEKKAQEQLQLAQNQLIEADKMASLGQLTAGVAHEINNPVNFVATGINGLEKNLNKFMEVVHEYEQLNNEEPVADRIARIERLKEQLDYEDLKTDIQEMLATVDDGARRAARIVKSLQTFTWSSEEQLVLEDLHEGLDSTLLLMHNQTKNKVDIIKRFGARNPVIEGSPGQINQVFMNVINNALHAVREESKPEVLIETYDSSSEVTITIADNGVGIPKDVIKKVFDPFFTTKPVGEGTGLGLSISYNIMKNHGGKIAASSEPGLGSRFRITIPKHQTQSKRA